ncbi:hypothetical protein [Fusibacter ferrireducens]|uniref:Uncharacterized protein n=1 Tax=Fusibacter ferrireducens TaxID=2785058 RepID=A0ABR9ZV41_9FIRM|nr:hypothetical protein [Fusibacter ferrireducens]MBF4693454.1 hypothetical protein [Fusibacter ferrireducens]
MNEIKQKRIKKIITLVVLFAIVLHLIPIPFHKTYEAIEIKLDDPNYLEYTKVHIDGLYKINIGDDAFDGHIGVEGYDVTEGEVIWDIKISTHLNLSGLSYQLDTDRDPMYSFGNIISEPFFKHFALVVWDNIAENKKDVFRIPDHGHWSGTDGYCIVPNVTTREEALKALKALNMIKE